MRLSCQPRETQQKYIRHRFNNNQEVNMRYTSLFLTVFALLFSTTTFARGGGGGGGGFSIGANFGVLTAGQDDMNTLQQRANTRAGGITTAQLGNAWEASGTFGYRFSGTIFEMILRPTYFWQTTEGAASGGSFPGSYKYSVSGFTIFPMLRMYPLENDLMKFFFQFGVGYGKLKGSITEASFSADFNGGTFGYLAGLGVEMCFTDSHCIALEGNLRGLPAERLLVDSVSGSPAGTNQGIDNGMSAGKELEMDGRDVKITGSGIQATLGYVMRF